jgi:hypothetical protein
LAFVLMMGDVMGPDVERFARETGCRHVAKPFEVVDVIAAFETALGTAAGPEAPGSERKRLVCKMNLHLQTQSGGSMLKRVIASLGAGVLIAVALPAAAQAQMQMGEKPEGKEATVTGYVIDLSCKFRHGLSGEQHRMCAQVCADKGVPLAILGTDGTLYVPVSAGMPGESENAKLKPHAEHQVTVKGTVYEAGGAKAIEIASVSM